MNINTAHSSSLDLSEIAFHPTETLAFKVKQALLGFRNFVLVTLFIMGLPIFALAVIDFFPRLFGR